MNQRGVLPVCRFDVIALDGEHMAWLQNAFDAAGHL
jgi:Holliday junction resolvase-like predicted endonuclease